MRERLQEYFDDIGTLGQRVLVTDRSGRGVPTDAAVQDVIELCLKTHDRGNKLMFVGNGGSAGICSHQAIDYTKAGRIRALSFNDGAALTCLGNDLGYENVFAVQIEAHGRAGDVLIAISSSGRSANILKAVAAARARDADVVTLSGFAPDNPLRKFGDVNFYVPSDRYGFVEISHLAICHLILDLICARREAGVAT